jgi:hypothetical protein
MTKHPRQRRLRAALAAVLLLALTPAPALPHWISPEEIIAGIKQDPVLRQNLGVVDARVDPKLPRLLLVLVRRSTWDTVAPEKRIGMAQLWYETWRHNVDQGIVAVLDESTQKSLVHFDANGKAELRAR